MNLDEVLAKLNALPPEKREAIAEQVMATTKDRRFIPSPGPQTEAYFSKADVLLYGGAGGGGKTALVAGLALEEHTRSLIMRRNGTDLEGGGGMIEEVLRFHGGRSGFNGSSPPTLRTDDDRIITFGGANNIGDEDKYRGRARDFLALDEATQFALVQVQFLMGWIRTEVEGQRTRALLASNPPTTSTGDWIIGMFRPWLDTTHANPAEPGELRWFVTDPDGNDMEVDGPEPRVMDGRTVQPKSRTFVPAKLSDNPFLANSDYAATLDALPEPMRSALRDGNFMIAREDNAFQVVPTQWIREAQARWTDRPPEHAPMSAIAADIAQGGTDSTILSARYDGWFDKLVAVPGSETPTGNEVAGLLISHRRNGATVIIDMGGGYGGATMMRLKDNQMQDVVAHKGAESTSRRSNDQQFGFVNVRSEKYWRLREALDPSQDGGSHIALPDDPELVSDLTAPEFEITSNGIKITPKDKVVALLGRSPDKGDAVVMCNGYGPKLQTHGNQWRKYSAEHGSGRKTVNVQMSRMAARKVRK